MENFVLTTNIRIILSLLAAAGTIYFLRSQLKATLRPLQYAVIGLVTLTAFIHLLSGANDYLLFLNGFGYMVLLLALYFPPLDFLRRNRALMYLALMGYTLVTIAGYFVVHPWGGLNEGFFDLLGWLTKAIELALLVILFLDWRQNSAAGSPLTSSR